jgi:putative ABC transport system permease protein
MRFLSRVRSWLRAMLRRSRMESEMDAELRFHLEAYADDLVRNGVPRNDAMRRARIEFGAVERAKEECREARTLGFIDGLVRDFRYAVRTLHKSPGFAAVAVLTLALGIGANTAVFSVVNTVLLRPLPFPHASELLDISARSTQFDFTNLNLSLLDIADIRTASQCFAAVTPYQSASRELSGSGHAERVDAANITEDFFPTLEVAPALGRGFTAADIQPDSRSVIVSDRLWRQRFGGDTGVVGKSITIDGEPRNIVGVMPPLSKTGFSTDDDLWMPLNPSDDQRSSRKNRDFSVLARLKPGRKLGEVQQELDLVSARLAAEHPEANKDWSFHATSLATLLLGDMRAPLLTLFCAVGFVLLIACANVSNLLLSRGLARRREFAIRSALGASRAALMRQLFVETALVSLAGGACAFLMAAGALQFLRSLLPPQTPRLEEIGVSGALGGFTFGISLLAAITSGLAPALLDTRRDVSSAVKEGGVGALSSAKHHNFLRRALLVGQVAVAVVLLVGATLTVQSFRRMIRANLGFRPEHIVTMQVEFPEFRFAKPEQGVAFVEQVIENSRTIPGVEATSAGFVFPLGDSMGEMTFQIEASAAANTESEQSALGNSVTPDFFHTFGIPLLAGRDFTDHDTKGKPLVFVVNEALARKCFGSLDVIGKRLFTRKEQGKPLWGEIVGVAGNVRSLLPGFESKVQIYEPLSQAREVRSIFLAVRTKADPLSVVPAIQDRVWAIDKNRPITMIKTVDQQIAEDFAEPRSQSLLLSLFSGLGFALALVGVYGVMSYLVSQQTKEIGIRMALGAAPSNVLRSNLAQGSKLTLAGVAIGLGASFVLTRFLRSLLFGVSATDPVTFAGVAVALTLVALAACAIPARRAMRVDPMVALRHE